jgi:hypothetical protein
LLIVTALPSVVVRFFLLPLLFLSTLLKQAGKSKSRKKKEKDISCDGGNHTDILSFCCYNRFLTADIYKNYHELASPNTIT